MANVAIYPDEVVSLNRLSMAFQHDWDDAYRTHNSAAIQQQIVDSKFKLIRIFVYRNTYFDAVSGKGPCLNWNSSTHTGVFDWSGLDTVVNDIIALGCEPLLCLLHPWTTSPWPRLPQGMTVDPVTGLPTPVDMAAYCREFVKHYKGKVRLWEIYNEPGQWWGWHPTKPWSQKIIDAMNCYLVSYNAMKMEDPDCLISHDYIQMIGVWDYHAEQGIPYDFWDFHTYPSGKDLPDGYDSDRTILDVRSRYPYFGSADRYSVANGIQKYRQLYGIDPPYIIVGETNYNSAWQFYGERGTDPRCVQIQNVVYAAMTIIWGMQMGITHRCHFNTTSSPETFSTPDYGTVTSYGFGMIRDNGQPWYPLLLYNMIGNNLDDGDPLLRTTSNHSHIIAQAWRNKGKMNLLVVNKDDANSVSVALQGVSGMMSYRKLSGAIDFLNPGEENGVLDVSQPFMVGAMSVMLLQGEESQQKYTLSLESSPVDVYFSVNDILYPSGSVLEFLEGQTVRVSVPEEIER